jgi:hypothetical protein
MCGIHSEWSDHNRAFGGGREPAVQNHSCNLAREWRTLEKEVRIFYSNRL